MKYSLSILLAALPAVALCADTFSYKFRSTPVSVALSKICDDHPELDINFIYDVLENYTTSATINTTDAYDALQTLIGLNPITVSMKGRQFFVEALQKGKYRYTGSVIGSDHEPVAAATVMVLAPKDSTVITYAITDEEGRFSIPCDRRDVIGKFSCIGYLPRYQTFTSFNVGKVTMQESPVWLKGVSVEAQRVSSYPDRTVFMPTSRQRISSQGGIDLLRQMAIPQIDISPIDNLVTDNTGETVAIYINNLEASREELAGLRTEDVRKVEYLESPTDPRFRGASRVINIMVRENTYGGYTKATLEESVLTGLSSNAGVFSKFSYGKMVYDFYAGAVNYDNKHNAKYSESVYRLNGVDGLSHNAVRKETPAESRYKDNQYPVTLRATYNTDKVQIRNLAGYTFKSTPANIQSGSVDFSGNGNRHTSYNRNNRVFSNSLTYRGTFFFSLPNDFSFDLSPSIIYTHSKDDFIYSTDESDPILRNARENSFMDNISLTASKRFGRSHTAIISVNKGDFIHKLRYKQLEVADKYHTSFGSGKIGYGYRASKFSISLDAQFNWERSDINGVVNTDVYPGTNLSISYTPDTRNSLSLSFLFGNNLAPISQKVSDILQDNEYLYITGNPYLKSNRLLYTAPSYIWMPSNNFTLSVFGSCFLALRRPVEVYESYDEGMALLRTYMNSGNYLSEAVGVSLNWKLLDGKLQLSSKPRHTLYHTTGIYRKSYPFFTADVQAIYYMGPLYIQAYYQTRQKSMSYYLPGVTRTRNYYSLSLGMSKGNFNVKASAINIFNKGYRASVGVTDTPLFSETLISYGTTYHPCLNFSLTYTFGYGKKVQRNNEVGGQTGSSSAILK